MMILLVWLVMGSSTLIMSSSIANTRAIVTGGANGLGKTYAYHLLQKGAKVVAILDKDVKNGTMTTKDLNDQFGENRAVFFSTDVTKPDEFEENFNRAVEKCGGLDIMINNAGIFYDSKWSLEIDTNVKGVIQGTLMAIDAMGKHKGGNGGTVINIASTAALVVSQYSAGYAATKHAVLGFSRGIALNYNQTGVAIKTICPGATDTLFMKTTAHRYFGFIDQDEAFKYSQEYPLQKPERVSPEVMRLIEEAPNGAIWVVELGSPTTSLDIPEYTEWETPV